jgi:endonuclease/exonuclease/phosphatase (EEP) superfamily protein YafD
MALQPPSRSKRVGWFALMTLLAMVLITVIGLGTSRYGWPLYLELLSHFQRQYFALCVLGLVAIAWLRDRIRCAISLACVAALASQILPWYLPSHLATPALTENFRILIVNIRYNNPTYAPLLAFAQQEQPDLALFIEVNQSWREALHRLQSDLPYVFEEDDDMVLYSRQPFSDIRVRNLSPEAAPVLWVR